MQELCKFNVKTNVITNELEKYMSFAINNKLRFIDSFQFLSSSLGSDEPRITRNPLKNQIFDLFTKSSSVKNLGKGEFKIFGSRI